MPENKKEKTLQELSGGIDNLTSQEIAKIERQLKLATKSGDTLLNVFLKNNKVLEDRLRNLDDYVESLEEQQELLIKLEKFRQMAAQDAIKLEEALEEKNKETNKRLEEKIELTKALTEEQRRQAQQIQALKRGYDLLYDGATAALNKVIQQSEDLFKVSHDLQLQGNMTWNQYTKLYNDSFEALRDMNTALGQSVFNTRQLFETQQKLVPKGWKGIDTEHLTQLSGAVTQINAVLGMFPEELSTAFQMSYRQFEAQTDRFVYAIGNRLNAFSDSFGVTVGALTGAVTQMMAANTYLARNNMQAQILASESLMGAVALSSAVGIETSNFMVGLAHTAQFGTASQMSELFQAGAMLQGFSTQDFQSKMRTQDYMGATQDLIQSIQQTLGGMDDGYLKNEYIQRISQGFGLSQSDVLQLMSNDFDLNKKSLEIQEKLVDVDTSMEQELRGLKVSLKNRLDNWWDSTKLSQGLGKFMQDQGLAGIDKQLNRILYAILGQSMQKSLWDTLIGAGGTSVGAGGAGASGGGVFGNLFGSTAGGGALTGMQKMSRVLGGVGIAGAGMHWGSQLHQDENVSQVGAGIHGSLANIGSGILGGALTGSAFGGYGALVGGIIGGIAGAGKSVFDIMERDKAEKRRADDIIDAGRQAMKPTGDTTDPVAALVQEQKGTNQRLDKILGTIDYNHAEDMEFKFTVNMSETASTKG